MLKKIKDSADRKFSKAGQLISEAAAKLSGEIKKDVSRITKGKISATILNEKIKTIRHTVSVAAEEALNQAEGVTKTAKNIVTDNITLENAKKISDYAYKANDKENYKKVGRAITDAATLENAKDVATYASGALKDSGK